MIIFLFLKKEKMLNMLVLGDFPLHNGNFKSRKQRENRVSYMYDTSHGDVYINCTLHNNSKFSDNFDFNQYDRILVFVDMKSYDSVVDSQIAIKSMITHKYKNPIICNVFNYVYNTQTRLMLQEFFDTMNEYSKDFFISGLSCYTYDVEQIELFLYDLMFEKIDRKIVVF